MNTLSNKFLGFFVVLVVTLATLTASNPIPELDKRHPVMHVPAPNSATVALNSIQNVSWWCNGCSSKDNVIVKVRDGRATYVQIIGRNAKSGTAMFIVDPTWATLDYVYFVEVDHQTDISIAADSKPFTVVAA
ncbi:370_t:CDS:2 [Paraglomus occultum]|uniref:370_t:CDS:1 n=1 Tax=Paraglomus occultum TaxID=144539 RepID=A0A9N9B4J1_9GLOM|nr:370_t:CDS:2 [Paraglomus occultum]